MKRITKESVIVCAVAGLGLAAGWLSAKSGGEAREGNAVSAERSGGKSMRVRGPMGGRRGAEGTRAAGDRIDPEFLDWLRSASVEEMRQVVLEEFRGSGGRSSFQAHAILQELVRANAPETYEFFRTREVRRSGLVTAVVQIWAALDPHAATEQVVKHAALDEHNHRGEVSACFRALARVDLESALGFADKMGPRRLHDAYRALLAGYAMGAPKDIARVIELAGKKGFSPKHALTTWATVDPDSAIEWLRTRGSEKPDGARYLARGLVHADPARAMAIYHEFNGIADGRNYYGVAANILGQWMKNDYSAALAWLEGKGTEDLRSSVLKRSFVNLASADPEFALERLLAGDAAAAEHLPWGQVISNLARKKSEDEILGLLERAPDELKPAVRDGLIGAGFIEASPEVLAELAAGREDGRYYNTIRTTLARNPESFSTFLMQVPEEKRGQFIENMGRSVAAGNPEVVLEAVESLQDPALYEETGAQWAIAALAHSRPESAMRAVEGLPEGKAREYGAQTLVNNLVADDPDGALEWLNRQRGSMSNEGIWKVASRLPYSAGVKERVEEMFGDLDPRKKKDGKPGAGAGAGGGAIIGGSIGN